MGKDIWTVFKTFDMLSRCQVLKIHLVSVSYNKLPSSQITSSVVLIFTCSFCRFSMSLPYISSQASLLCIVTYSVSIHPNLRKCETAGLYELLID